MARPIKITPGAGPHSRYYLFRPSGSLYLRLKDDKMVLIAGAPGTSGLGTYGSDYDHQVYEAIAPGCLIEFEAQ